MKRAILSAALAIAFIAGVSAQAKPNFAGRWKADNSFNSWTITVDGNKMTVTMTVAGNSDSIVYTLDGTPTKKRIDTPNGPAENVYTCTWEGDTLVTTINTAFNSTLVEKRWLEPDGTMKVQTTLTHMQGKPAPPPPPGAGLPVVLKKVG
jgi:hypothetical protein